MELNAIFHRVARHLLDQNQRCFARGQHVSEVCMFRHQGLACAVGCLLADLPDDEVAELEGCTLDSPPMRSALRKCGVVFDDTNMTIDLLADLQELHDTISPSRWAEALRGYASHHEIELDADLASRLGSA